MTSITKRLIITCYMNLVFLIISVVRQEDTQVIRQCVFNEDNF